MRASQHCADPFDLLIDPEAVLRAVAASTPLHSLARKICRPLDRTQTPLATNSEATDFRDSTENKTNDDLI